MSYLSRCVRWKLHSDQTQIQILIFFCFNWEAGQWAPSQGTDTQSYLHFESCHSGWMLLLDPSRLCNLKARALARPGQFASLASSVSTALTESNRDWPPLKSRAVSESLCPQQAHITRQGLSQCGDGLSWDVNHDPGPSCGSHGRRRGPSGTCAVDPSSRDR
jgi:hypothetical protein